MKLDDKFNILMKLILRKVMIKCYKRYLKKKFYDFLTQQKLKIFYKKYLGKNFYEAKILFGDELAKRWHWGLNLYYEREISGVRMYL